MKFKVKNFQALGDVELDFPVGITALIGSSNSGKTSIIRALTSVLSNSSEAKTFIKHGKDKSEVSLEMENLPKIKWTRTLKDSTYEIDGVLHQKVGRVDLFDILPSNGFCKDDEGNILNIQDEWSTLFPFDRSDSQMYKLFEEVFAINDSSLVLHKIKVDESERKKITSDLNGKIDNNRNKISKIEEFLKRNDLTNLINNRDDLCELDKSLSSLDKDSEEVIQSLKLLSKFKTISALEGNFNLLDELPQLMSDVDYLQKNIPVVEYNVELLDGGLTKLDDYLRLKDDVNYIENNISFLEFNIKSLDCKEMLLDSYQSLDLDSAHVLEYLREYKELTSEEKLMKQQLTLAEEEYSKIKICPLCNQDIK